MSLFNLLSFIFALHCFCLVGDNHKPFITTWLRYGQLGNQFHEIATTLAYAWDHDFDAFFPSLNNKELNLSVNRDRIFFRLNTSKPPREILSTFHQLDPFKYVPIPNKPDQMLKGYFQNWHYYHHYRDKLIQLFALKDEELEALKTKHHNLLSQPMTVAVHVRTFNKQWSKVIPFVGLDYYERAFNLFPKDAIFVIFSDRINWCKHHFKKFDRTMIFMEGQDHIEDFFLMSMLKHHIIGNSSYSWWAAYLNVNPDKIVVTPSHFVHPSRHKEYNSILPEWIELEIDYNYRKAPYPNDINHYDSHSQSINTQ